MHAACHERTWAHLTKPHWQPSLARIGVQASPSRCTLSTRAEGQPSCAQRAAPACTTTTHAPLPQVGVFDTGIRAGHPHVRNIRARSDWTHQQAFSDGLGHGSFVAGVISSAAKECPGFAPDVELHTFKVFTDDQVRARMRAGGCKRGRMQVRTSACVRVCICARVLGWGV